MPNGRMANAREVGGMIDYWKVMGGSFGTAIHLSGTPCRLSAINPALWTDQDGPISGSDSGGQGRKRRVTLHSDEQPFGR